MSKALMSLIMAAVVMLLAGAPLLAQMAAQPGATPGQESPEQAQKAAAGEAINATKASLFRISIIVGGIIITLTVAAGAFCQAKSISAACEGISRNPGGAPHIRFVLIFGLVLIETLVIYALLITIIILMVQWGKYI